MKESHFNYLLANAWLIGAAISGKWVCLVISALWIAADMYSCYKEKENK